MAKAKAKLTVPTQAVEQPKPIEANGKSAGHKSWSGGLMLGPITIPVAMFVAGRAESISFSMLHRECRQQIKQVGYYCPCCVEAKVVADFSYVSSLAATEYANAVAAAVDKDDEELVPPIEPQKIICKKGETVIMHGDDFTSWSLKGKVEATGNAALVEGDYVVKGYEMTKNSFVIIDKEEIKALKPESGASVHIETFVPQDQVSPIYFESSYYLGPDEAVSRKSYSVLREGLIRRKVAAIGKICMRQTENLVFILPHPDGGLIAYTAYLADEIRQIKFPQPTPVSDEEAKAVCNFIDAMTEDLDMGKYKDDYRERLTALIQAKQEGKTLPAEVAKPKPVQSDNLLEMLTASTIAARQKKERKTA